MEEIPVIIKVTIILLVITVAAFIVYLRRAKRIAEETPRETATLNDIPAIVSSLAKHGEDERWVMFVLPQSGNSDEDCITVQFSVDQGEVGFDWLLDNGLGHAHRSKFEELARRRGWPVTECDSDGFHYLRVQGLTPLEIGQVGKEVLTALYNIYPNQQLEIEQDAEDWRVGA
jgi:hypothetical protein